MRPPASKPLSMAMPVALAGFCVGLCRANPPWPTLQQGHEDVEPLARSLRTQPIDFRAPTGFEQVYDLGDGRLARIDGGLYAVFPRSTYRASESGFYPTIPPGTTFYIGPPPGLATAASPFPSPPIQRTAAAPVAIERSTRAHHARPAASAADELFPRPARRTPQSNPIPTHRPHQPAPTIFSSDAERDRILGVLLERARRAG